MARTTPSTVEVETFAIDDIRDLAYSFLNALEAQNKSPKTVKTYGEAVTQLTAFLLEQTPGSGYAGPRPLEGRTSWGSL